jgi:hypothetical protein
VTATLPAELRDVFDRFITTEYVTIDRRGQSIAWPVTPYHHAEHGCIDVTTGLGYPKKADDAARNPRVALLFSDSKGSGLADAPMVLVQGTAVVDDRDLAANRRRYVDESASKLPAAQKGQPPAFLRGLFAWYYDRVYVHVRPERVYVWPAGDTELEPALYGAHVEEVRSGHDELPIEPVAEPSGATSFAWDPRVDQLGGADYPTAVLAFVGPDGFPFAVRVPVRPDAAERVVRIEAEPVGAPLQSGLACLTAHDHDEAFTWQRNFQVRGDLVEDDRGWVLIPRKLVGGFELPPGSLIARMRLNAKKIKRFRAIAKDEHAKRSRPS